MKEYSVSLTDIGKEVDYVTFDQFVEQITGESFSNIYNRESMDKIIKEGKNERQTKSNLE